MKLRKNNFLAPAILLALSTGLAACSAPPKRATLRDVDIIPASITHTAVTVKPKSEAEIKQAYAEYLKFAAKDDKARMDALQRLAQLEFDLSEKLAKNKGQADSSTDAIEDKIYDASLNRTIELLQVSLRDYPNAKDNDRAYYQLAKAYDQRGDYDKAIDTLKKLTEKYPGSTYYAESQFRLAEQAFSARQYTRAEDIYTDILVSRKNNLFYEKALYKRGWARFKQEFYQDAIEDFTKVVELNNFDEYTRLADTQKQLFDEYFRAIGLCFSYLGGAEQLNAYFKANPDLKFAYYSYASVSDIYLKQQRYNDSVATLEHFISSNPKSAHVPEAYLKIIDTWQQSGFSNRAITAIDALYKDYHPDNQYWQSHTTDLPVYNKVKAALKDYIIAAASTFHKEYRQSKQEAAYNNANKWYQRYLAHYQSTSRKDNIHYLYADLLAQHKNAAEALQHYEYAAYDSDIILNKDAAYETILLASSLYKADPAKNPDNLNKLLKYSLLYTQLYQNDPRALKIIAFAAETAYSTSMYNEAIKLVEQAPSNNSLNLSLIKAHSYYRLKQYKEAEGIYLSILQNDKPDDKTRTQLLDNLAISIYNQAAASAKNNKTTDALRDYARISELAPNSSIAATGLYDAISLAINTKLWNESITYIKRFQTLYPHDQHSNDVAKKLSVAYLSSNQDINAASELVKLSRLENDNDYTMAALWKAAELYETKKDYTAAINSYTEYARRFTSPYPQYLEALFKLSQLNSQRNDQREAQSWRNKIVDIDRREAESNKTQRTKFIASTAALSLAVQAHAAYSALRLTLPLEQSLRRKKAAMQNAVNLYGRASAYGAAETATEATHGIAEIYREFSKALLDSERPRHLKPTELEQYKILLEDQAFPFEEKAIEFYETNLTHVRDGINDSWIQQSLARLKELFPARYTRQAKLERYINALH